jgi:hypothetical protein
MTKFLIFLAILGMVACRDGIIVSVTPTPERINPTPTREQPSNIPGISDTCSQMQLDPGFYITSPNPCLVMPEMDNNKFWRPSLFTTVYRQYEREVNKEPTTEYHGGGYEIDVTRFAGEFGYTIPITELMSGRCYVLKVVADSNITYGSYPRRQADTNYAMQVTIYRNGITSILPSQNFQNYIGHNAWIWGIYSNDQYPTIMTEIRYTAQYGYAGFGSWLRFTEIGIYQTNNTTYCAGVSGV